MKKPLIAVVILLLLQAGCTTRSRWKRSGQESPLYAPDEAAIAVSRRCSPPFYIPAAPWTEQGWRIGRRIIDKHDVVKRIDDHLLAINYYHKQHPLRAWSNGIQQRIAAYRFFIVALNPTVVIMAPYDYGDATNKSDAQLASAFHDRLLRGRLFVNGYHHGKSVPIESRYKWFSPEIRTPILDVQENDGLYHVSHERVMLTFGTARTNNFYLVERSR